MRKSGLRMNRQLTPHQQTQKSHKLPSTFRHHLHVIRKNTASSFSTSLEDCAIGLRARISDKTSQQAALGKDCDELQPDSKGEGVNLDPRLSRNTSAVQLIPIKRAAERLYENILKSRDRKNRRRWYNNAHEWQADRCQWQTS
jgi:hypothetical protein